MFYKNQEIRLILDFLILISRQDKTKKRLLFFKTRQKKTHHQNNKFNDNFLNFIYNLYTIIRSLKYFSKFESMTIIFKTNGFIEVKATVEGIRF